MTDLLELSPDLVLDLPRLTMIGRLQISLENHHGLAAFTDERIVIATASGDVVIVGEDLHIGMVDGREITVHGRIAQVCFAEDAL